MGFLVSVSEFNNFGNCAGVCCGRRMQDAGCRLCGRRPSAWAYGQNWSLFLAVEPLCRQESRVEVGRGHAAVSGRFDEIVSRCSMKESGNVKRRTRCCWCWFDSVLADSYWMMQSEHNLGETEEIGSCSTSAIEFCWISGSIGLLVPRAESCDMLEGCSKARSPMTNMFSSRL